MRAINLAATILLTAACNGADGTRPDAATRVSVADLIRTVGDERITTSPITFGSYVAQLNIGEFNPLMIGVRAATAPVLSRSAVLADPDAAYSFILLPAQSGNASGTRAPETAVSWSQQDVAAVRALVEAGGGSHVASSSRTVFFVPPTSDRARASLLAALAAHRNFDHVTAVGPRPASSCRVPIHC